MTGFLGFQKKTRRVRRFWAELGSFIGGLGTAVLSVFGVSNQPDMSVYDQQISALKIGQVELMNKMNLQTTVFMADAEKKRIQIEWLQKTQNDIQNKVTSLESNMMVDSKEKTKQINELKSMLNETQKKLAQQEETQKKMMKNIHLIEDKLVGVDKKLQELSLVVSEQGKSLNETNLKVEFNSLTIDFNFLFDQFEAEQTKLFYVIKRAKKGELDPYVLTPLNLIEMLQNIIPNMQENEKFPFFPNIENARNLYNLINPEVYFYNYTLLFILKMPLVHLKSFDLYKITSLPIPLDKNIFAFILPKDPFLLIDKIYHEYLTMPFQEYIDFCQQIDKKLLCKQTQPLYSVFSESRCEVALLTTSRSVPDTCNKRIMYLKDIVFLQLQKAKSWIYLAPKVDSPIFVNCDLQKHSVLIEGSGFISLSNNCKMRYSQYGIESLTEFTKTVESNYTASINLIDFIAFSETDKSHLDTHRNHKNLILPFNLNELADISVAIENNNSSLSSLYFLFLLPVVIIIIAISLLIYLKKIDIKLMIPKCMSEQNESDGEGNGMVEKLNSSEEEKFKLKLKMNKKHEQVSSLSIREVPSGNDPDSEYLTVRVKVKKDVDNKKYPVDSVNQERNTKAKMNYTETRQNCEISEDDIYDNSDVIIGPMYLNDLRKLKPKIAA